MYIKVQRKVALPPQFGNNDQEKLKIVKQITPSTLDNCYTICPYDERYIYIYIHGYK
jgi:hypothetical protein